MFASIVIALAIVVPGGTPGTTRECQFDRVGDPARDERALTGFAEAVNHYVELHRRLERPLPALLITSDPEEIAFASGMLAGAIRDARPMARIGDIFKPDVADVFRALILKNLREHNYNPAAIAAAMREDESNETAPADVNQLFPWEAGNMMWGSMLATLPPLPPELEYRFVERDLVLIDVDANLVIDVLELALPLR